MILTRQTAIVLMFILMLTGTSVLLKLTKLTNSQNQIVRTTIDTLRHTLPPGFFLKSKAN